MGRDMSKSAATAIKQAVIDNRERLLIEIKETRDLYELLIKWRAGTELNAAERARVKAQLIDICKTIPALAIFILPLGGLVLIFLIKFLKFNILPTAFNDDPVSTLPPREDDAINRELGR